MNKAFEKILERSYNATIGVDDDDRLVPYDRLKQIVHEVAEEYGPDTNVGSNGWIRCSERIPTENERWLGKDITDAEPREFIVILDGAYEPTTGYYHSGYGCWVKDLTSEYDGKNTGYANEIVAWMFFPEPYKTKRE